MPTGKKLYIDKEGVERGYYVYLHKDRATGEVFYIGKEHGERAWETDRRNTLWKEKVSSLTNGWVAEIVEQDLSELEAFDLEAELVEHYGGPAADGGALTNWIPGGEHPVSIQLGYEFEFNDGGWTEAYYDARKFKEFPHGEKEIKTLAVSLKKELDGIIVSLQHLENEAKEKEDKELVDSIAELDSTFNNLRDVLPDFLAHRVSRRDFAITLEEAYDELEWMIEDITENDKRIRHIVREILTLTMKTADAIASVNREEAEAIATRMTTAPAAEQGDAAAQVRLAYRYTTGRGVSQDDVQAYRWCKLATAQGYSGSMVDAIKDILRNRMTIEQIAEAERLIRKVQPKASKSCGRGDIRK